MENSRSRKKRCLVEDVVAPPLVIDGQIVDRKWVRFQIDACHAFIGVIIEKYKKGELKKLRKL